MANYNLGAGKGDYVLEMSAYIDANFLLQYTLLDRVPPRVHDLKT